MSFKPIKYTAITGATSGIGLATAKGLVKSGHFVFLLGRNKDRLNELVKEFPEGSTQGVWMDLAQLNSVQQAAQEIISSAPHLDHLILNAGGIFERFQETSDGFEWSFQINHLSHFLLTQLLLPSLLASEHPRVISVSSEAHRLGKLNPNDLELRSDYGAWKQYGQTKLMNILFTKMLHSQYNPQGLSAFALHPGVVRSGFASNNSGWMKYFGWMPFLKTPEQGAETSLYLAKDPAVFVLSGQYFKNKQVAKPSEEALNERNAQIIWTKSMELLQSRGYLVG